MKKQIDGQLNLFDWAAAIQPKDVDIRGICDDAYCPNCDDAIDEFKYLDCEVCPYCGARIKWDRWHKANDKDNEKLWGPDWRKKYNK